MEYRKLGKSGLTVSVLGFGALEIGRNWPYWRMEKDDFIRPDESLAISLLYKAVDQGVNYFDTAPAYMESETLIGKAFKGMRKDIVIGTKCGEWFDGKNSIYDYTYSETQKFIENSLRQLRTDYIDLLQIHSANADVIRRGETFRAMKEAQVSGKVRSLGLSTDDIETAILAIKIGDFDSIQVSYNAINLALSNKVFPLAQEHNIGVIVKDGMARGKLSSKYSELSSDPDHHRIEKVVSTAEKISIDLSELAIRFIISNPIVSSVIIGTKKADHFQSNVAAVQKGALSDEILNSIKEINT